MHGVKTVRTMGYSSLGEEYEFMGLRMPASKALFESAERFAIVVSQLLKHKKIRPLSVDVRKTGLEGLVSEGLPELKSGEVSGKKLVYLL